MNNISKVVQVVQPFHTVSQNFDDVLLGDEICSKEFVGLKLVVTCVPAHDFFVLSKLHDQIDFFREIVIAYVITFLIFFGLIFNDFV